MRPEAGGDLWQDWRWQLRTSATSLAEARRLCRAPGAAGDPETAAAAEPGRAFPLRATPYFLALIERWDESDPIFRQVIPTAEELRRTPGELDDPIGDRAPHLLASGPAFTHRRPDRLLLRAAMACAVHCRHCFRRAGRSAAAAPGASGDLEAALAYLAGTPSIREAIVTGGDPLMLEDDRLLGLLARLAAIPHLRLLRIHSRLPVVNPFRVTPELTAGLAALGRPLRLVVQANSPRELTPECRRALGRLVEAGIPVLNQSVLLAGVNDDPETLAKLCWRLAECRVQPYYLHQADKVPGTAHLRVPLARGMELAAGLRRELPGHAVPRFMVEIPGGHGKVPAEVGHVHGLGSGRIELTDLAGRRHPYPEPGPSREPA